MKNYFVTTIVILFVVLGAFFYSLRTIAPDYQYQVLIIGDSVMALLSISTYAIIKKQLKGNPQAFVRGVSGASFLKLMVCMVSILVYVLVNRPHIHKPTVFVLLGIYLVYTVVETLILSKLARTSQ